MTETDQGLTVRNSVFAQRMRLYYGRTRQFFALPGCYSRIRASGECPRSALGMASDLLALFFSYKTFPDHYGACRLWEVKRPDWANYYGSNYHPHQRLRFSAVKRTEYRAVFVDKFLGLTYASGLGIRTPLTYGVVGPEEDYRTRIRAWSEAAPAATMIIKPLYGRAGKGIVLAKRIDRDVLIQSPGGSVPLDHFVLNDRSIVQEWVRQHAAMAVFCPTSVNTLRIVTMLTPKGEVLLVNASFRTGARGSYVDNFSAGGVSPGVDRETGRLKKYAYDNAWKRYESHPDSGIVFEGYAIPGWDRIRAFAATVQRGFAFYRLIGLDVAIDADGEPVLIEVNGAPDLMGLEQKAGPLLQSRPVLEAFGDYHLLVNRHQKKLLSTIAGHSDPAGTGGHARAEPTPRRGEKSTRPSATL